MMNLADRVTLNYCMLFDFVCLYKIRLHVSYL